MQDVISGLLHEFTHYLYWKYPKKAKIGERKIAAIKENSDTSRPGTLEEYKKRPQEAPAYYVQDYFEKHKFAKQLFSKIKTIQHGSHIER